MLGTLTLTIVLSRMAVNALIITAPEPQYRQMRAVIDKLDTRRAQVYVEGLVAEVNATKAAEFDPLAGQKENFARRFFVERCHDAFQQDLLVDRKATVVFQRQENDSRHSFGIGDFRGGEDFAGHLVGYGGDIL